MGNKDVDKDAEAGRIHEDHARVPLRTCQLHHCQGILLAAIVVLVIVFFIFVIFPVILMKSVRLQRRLIFTSTYSYFDVPVSINDYSNGTRNMYVVVDELQNITLGVVHYLPLALISRSVEDKSFNYDRSLAQEDYPVLLHFHGNGESRFANSQAFWRLREFFHVIGFDYRSYGDSSRAELSEEGVVHDSVVLYKWLRKRTGRDNIYVWGKSLGAAFATHTLAKLYDENITAMGLVLEAPFTTLRDEIKTISYVKIFSWLPWFEITVLDGFEKNGFVFNTTAHILKVDCPIIILHAEDDSVVPYKLGRELFQIARNKRNPETQGTVTFYSFPAQCNYNHWGITKAPQLPNYVRCHIHTCEKYNESKKKQY